MKKRYILKNKKRFVIILVITLSLISSMFLVATTRAKGYTEARFNELVITAGDTLWDIAVSNYGKNADIRKKISLIRKANEMKTAELSVGQLLLIPID